MRLKYRTSKRIQRGSTGLSYRYQMGIELVSQGCHDGIIAALKGTSQGHQNVMNGISAGGAKECRALIRGGPAFALSLVLSRLEPALRAEADMGAWQIISPGGAVGLVKYVDNLRSVMNVTFDQPTVIVAGKVGGDEEIPAGATAVLTTCSVDVLSHSAVRARNGGVLFATCYDDALLTELAALDGGRAVSMKVGTGDNIVWEEIDAAAVTAAAAGAAAEASSIPHGLKLAQVRNPIHVNPISHQCEPDLSHA